MSPYGGQRVPARRLEGGCGPLSGSCRLGTRGAGHSSAKWRRVVLLGPMRGSDGRETSMNLTRTKTIEQSIADTEESEHQLRKELGPLQLTVFGVGVIIGTGIFVLTGEAAGEKAGPAVAFSFVFSGIACALAALCYAEFASTVPVAGSAYTFSYASLGEIVAWIIGWDLVLELALGASTVAVGWSTYLADVLDQAGITIPAWLYGEGHNLIAAAIVLALTAVICTGIKISSQVNFVFVAIKLSIVLLVIVAGLFFIKM